MWGFLTRYRKKLARSLALDVVTHHLAHDASVGHSRWHIWSTTGSCTCSSPLQLMSLYHTPFRVTIIGLLVTSETMILYFYIHRTSYFIYSACLVCRQDKSCLFSTQEMLLSSFLGCKQQARLTGLYFKNKNTRNISSGMMNIVIFTHGEKKT